MKKIKDFMQNMHNRAQPHTPHFYNDQNHKENISRTQRDFFQGRRLVLITTSQYCGKRSRGKLISKFLKCNDVKRSLIFFGG